MNERKHIVFQLPQVVFCVTLVVVSSDEDFLSTFSETSMTERLVKPDRATFIFLTNFTFSKHKMSNLHKILTRTNSVHVVLKESPNIPR